ncbi:MULTISPECIES: hypothetical protein [Sorangium]|nr:MULTISPECIES: hypothetical protein [Sorangium]
MLSLSVSVSHPLWISLSQRSWRFRQPLIKRLPTGPVMSQAHHDVIEDYHARL